MLANIESSYKKIRRSLSRNEWMIRLLRLAPVEPAADTKDQPHPTGLVMIQIDGLGRAQFEKAIERGELPFLKHLLTRQHFQCHSMYSGLPSSTPGVQGELFYGVKGIVPAFGYRRKEDQKQVRMYEPAVAQKVQKTLHEKGIPLLDGGSAYCNIYTGGAVESHFCAASSGLDDIVKGISPLKWIVILALNLPTLFRTVALMVVEVLLAMIDLVRGLIGGRSFIPELKFIAARVFVSILLRDMVTISASMDIARGLPVIHLNYLGYDEQSHRRGPGSAFAHWTLKGIDRCIARLWNASHRHHKRHYDIWIYSDHGQEHTIPYQRLTGRTIHESVRDAIEERLGTGASSIHTEDSKKAGFVSERAKNLVNKPFYHLGVASDETVSTTPLVVAIGPVGHVYIDQDVSKSQKTQVAKVLVAKHQVPAAITVLNDGSLQVHTKRGTYRIPEQEKELFGADYPFLSVVGEDLQRLCQHQDAGDIVLLGCVHNVPAISFPMENGSHAGAGPNETEAFALIPRDTNPHNGISEFIRPVDLYRTAIKMLGRETNSERNSQTMSKSNDINSALDETAKVSNIARYARVENTYNTEQSRPLRIMTYNVHRCVGMDNIESPERIARVIARSRPDVIALQELDLSSGREDQIHQAVLIAKLLDMRFHFHPARVAENELYGDAILSSLPMRLVKADALPQPDGVTDSEIRGALWVELVCQGSKVQLINTHLGLRRRERHVQMEELTSERWLAHPDCHGPVILCGDFNALPGSKSLQQLDSKFQDVRQTCDESKPARTFASRLPLLPIDHIFVNELFSPVSVAVPDSELTRVASDHLPLFAVLHLISEGSEATSRHFRIDKDQYSA